MTERNSGLEKEILSISKGKTGAVDYCKYPGFRESDGQPMTIRRSYAFRSLLREHPKHIHSHDLVAGSMKGLGMITDDLESEEARERIAYVKGLGERTFITNFDHAAPNYDKLLTLGITGILMEIAQSLQTLDENDAEYRKKKDFLASVEISVKAFQEFILDYAQLAGCLVKEQTDPKRAQELFHMEAVCSNIVENPPQTFREALQLVWLTHLTFCLEGRYAMALGRLDQYLHKFYVNDMQEGMLREEDVVELLENVFLKIGERRCLWGGDDVVNICIGGVKPDGSDAANALSYRIIEAVKNCQLPGPNTTARVHARTSDAFYEKCLESIKTGLGYPAIANDEINVRLLVEKGYRIEDARNMCFAGCIENFLPGRQPPWVDGRFDTPKYIELALNNGICMLTGEKLGIETGDPIDFITFDTFFDAFMKQVGFGASKHIEHFIELNTSVNPEEYTSPFLSALFDDCIERGKDINNGGTVYPSNYGVGVMGIGTVCDSLAAVWKLVYEEKWITMGQLVKALQADFNGYEDLQHMLKYRAPKYGNDQDAVDRFAVWFLPYFGKLFEQYHTPDGGHIFVGIAANVNNISSGRMTAATPDGRNARAPLSDAASPTYGVDVSGPTAVINSITKADYTYSRLGSVLNLKFHPSFLEGQQRMKNMVSLLRTFFQKGGQEMQINVVDGRVLKDAMDHPDKYTNLMIRVSGFSARFTELDRDVQEDIIARTEHG